MNHPFSQIMQDLDPEADDFGPKLVNQILIHAGTLNATDIHLIPSAEDASVCYRIDGVLHTMAAFDRSMGQRLVSRLKVLSGLLTYRTDQPQEGRIRTGVLAASSGLKEVPKLNADVRVATFPTMFGEKVALRLFACSDELQQLNDLGLPGDVSSKLRTLVQQTSGVILLTGPSGSGKTTTVYACLRQLLHDHGSSRSLMTLEDPIEVVVPGLTQSQVKPDSNFNLTSGLKSMLRQDPDVIMVGEIRDPTMAEQAFQAALTGHLVVTTFHAGSAADAVTRLLDLGLEPYLLSSTLRAVVCQRLLRRKCANCDSDLGSQKPDELQKFADKNSGSGNLPAVSPACSTCGGMKYQGRFVTAELLDCSESGMSKLLSTQMDSEQREQMARDAGMVSLQDRCRQAIEEGKTDQLEVFRVMGV